MSDESSAASSSTTSSETSRRRMLAWMGAGGAAVLATLFSRNEARAGHDGGNIFHLGEVNFDPDTGTGTQLQADVNEFALHVENNNGGPGAGGISVSAGGTASGVEAFADSGVGVLGDSQSDPGVRGVSDSGIGGLFESNSNGVMGESRQGGYGVQGISDAHVNAGPEGGIGVQGVSTTNPGGLPVGDGPGVGVQGLSGTGIGVEAVSEDGLGLKVRGPAAFSTAGSAVIPAGADSAFVSNPAVTGDSHISVTIVSDPGSRQVTWVERSPGSGFTVHTSSQTKKAPEASMTYLVVEPA